MLFVIVEGLGSRKFLLASKEAWVGRGSFFFPDID